MTRVVRTRKAQIAKPTKLVSRLALGDDGTVSGFVFDPKVPEHRFTIDILLDGLVLKTAYADAFAPEYLELDRSNTCGFAVSIDIDLLRAARHLSARLANLGTPVGHPIDLEDDTTLRSDLRPTCRLRWLGGLHFQGWIDSETVVTLEAIVDGESVAQVRATAWTHIGGDAGGTSRNVRAFDFHVPQRLADGRVHRVLLRKEDGEQLPATATFVAFPDGLAGMIDAIGGYAAEQLRGKLYDQLIPASLPLHDYADWRERFPLPEPQPSPLRLAVVIAGSSGVQQTLASIEAQSHENWTAGAIDGEPLSIDSDALLGFLEDAAADAGHIVVTMAGVSLERTALARIAAAFDSHPDALAMYGDLDFLADDTRLWPLAFPAFDYERLLEQGYCVHLFAVRREALVAAIEAARPDNLYRLFNSLLDRIDPLQADILHLPGALATMPRLDRTTAGALLSAATQLHLQARGVHANVTEQKGNFFPAVRIKRPVSRQHVTVIIPTRDRVSLLHRCLETITPAVERCHADILVVDNDSAHPRTIDFLSDLPRRGIRTLRIEGPFNFARLNNQAVATLDSDILCLLNNDIEANSDDWLEEMLTRLGEPDVGAVGALLTWPGGVIQHGGVVLGMNYSVAHAFTDRFSDDPGFLDQLLVAHECSAVTAACLATRRSDYLAVGGMDEARFAVALNDVDYCLRLREAGKHIVLTPYAKLVHAESASRGSDNRADRRGRFEHELDLLRARWGDFLNDDPAYNPQLSRDGVPYSGLAWPPGRRIPRYNRPPVAHNLPLGF